MATPNLGLNVSIESNCTECCPRRLKIFCCCCKVDDDQQEKAKKVDDVAKEIFAPRVLELIPSDKEILAVLQITDVTNLTPRAADEI